VSLPVDTTMYKPVFESGAWISNGKADIEDSAVPQVVINQQAAERLNDPDIESVFPVTFKGKTYDMKLIGRIKEFDKAKLYVSDDWATRIVGLPDRCNTVLIKMQDDDYESVLSAKCEIENAISNSDLDVSYVMAQAERVKIIYDHLHQGSAGVRIGETVQNRVTKLASMKFTHQRFNTTCSTMTT